MEVNAGVNQNVCHKMLKHFMLVIVIGVNAGVNQNVCHKMLKHFMEVNH